MVLVFRTDLYMNNPHQKTDRRGISANEPLIFVAMVLIVVGFGCRKLLHGNCTTFIFDGEGRL
jgi:hypothetical protein